MEAGRLATLAMEVALPEALVEVVAQRVGTERIAMSAMLEPCYDVGGDSVDHAIDGATAPFAIVDAQGHGLHASVMANLAVRTPRRPL
jgi:hypothetical protein